MATMGPASAAQGGRVAWTKDEQKRFFEGYELFGADGTYACVRCVR
jgi:hypothetical protein